MKLVFVYNANSGRLNALFDIAHKTLSPSTYQCDLCSLTHGAFSEKASWKRFREESGIEMTFLHKDEFEKRETGDYPGYPLILKVDNGSMSVFMNRDEIARLANVDALILAINDKTAHRIPERPC